MRKVIYCGGNFEFQYKDFKPELMLSDYRTEILHGIDRILYQPKNEEKLVEIGKVVGLPMKRQDR